jgi:hypothetical protein
LLSSCGSANSPTIQKRIAFQIARGRLSIAGGEKLTSTL